MPYFPPIELILDCLPNIFPWRWYVHYQAPRRRRQEKWETFEKLKLKFSCGCSNSWTTMRGWCKIILWETPGLCHIFVVIYRQKCKFCLNWVNPRPYLDEIAQIIIAAIDNFFFGTENNDISRKEGNPKRKHDKDKCEACEIGVCSSRDGLRDN
eukprot:TRINITY_DN4776_c0_g1_i1.p1 TRINITY_DN4776_c0_g1~~TRINITY_DN4776_c0_g1_i1.p1  ORF type:complete len:154 (-),score=8.50 TRINITY_DN4776_c0_g1_i1:64-525(-)